MKIGAVIQARTGSTRLPGKVLLNLPFGSDLTVLQQVIRRVKKTKIVNEIIIATTEQSKDAKIIDIAKNENVKWFAGSENNVLERYYFTSKNNNLDHIVRITSDCPCIDPQIIDKVINIHLKIKCEYTSNTIKRTYARGLDAEIFSFATLEKIYKIAKNENEKEHVTVYILDNLSEFKTCSVEAEMKEKCSDLRITLDQEEDYALLCEIYDELYCENKFFTFVDIINLIKQKPWLKLINNHVQQKLI